MGFGYLRPSSNKALVKIWRKIDTLFCLVSFAILIQISFPLSAIAAAGSMISKDGRVDLRGCAGQLYFPIPITVAIG